MIFFFQAEDGIRDLVRSRGLGDVYKRQASLASLKAASKIDVIKKAFNDDIIELFIAGDLEDCLLYTSDAADERSSVDLGGRRIIKKKNNTDYD